MHDTTASTTQAPMDADAPVRLSQASVGDGGVIVEVRAAPDAGDRGVDVAELERRLLEFGFVEGAHAEVLHEGLFGGDPIAVRLDDMRVALRRRDAHDVWVRVATRKIATP